MAIEADAKVVEDVLAVHPLPRSVRDRSFEFGEDSTGDPALRVWLIVDNELNPKPEDVEARHQYARELRSDLLTRSLFHWPYVGFRSAGQYRDQLNSREDFTVKANRGTA
jgi:hypothetical protein